MRAKLTISAMSNQTKLPHRLQSKQLLAVVFTLTFAVLGCALLYSSFAQTPTGSIEAEGGTTSGGATALSDTSASAGKAVKFNSTSGMLWNEEFNGTSLDTSKWTVITGTEGNSQAHYTANNVSVANGYLDLRTRRHCVTSASDALTDANASTAVCAANLITEYSSGQVRTGKVLTSGRIEIRAKLPATQLGLWPAIWLRNPTPWCNTNYGELDVMEWYGDQPTIDTATTHITCANNSTVHMAHNLNTGVNLGNTWHTWAMTWNPTSVKYYFDGSNLNSASGDSDKLTDTYADFTGVTSSLFSTILNTTWEIRLNTQVTQASDAYHATPDNTKSYPNADYQIDYIRVYSN